MNSQINGHPDINRFLQQLGRARISCVDKRLPKDIEFQRFIPGSEIGKLFAGEHHVDILLKAVYSGSNSPVSASDVLTCCPKAFCILLEIGQGHWIDKFVHNSDLRDNRLPLTSRPSEITSLDVWNQFNQLQWEYFPESLGKTKSIFGEDKVIPFKERHYLNSGGSGKLFKVTLAREYDRLGLAPGVCNSLCCVIKTCVLLTCYSQEKDHIQDRQFALKTYSGPNAKWYFDTEVENFKLLYQPQSSYDEPNGHAPDGLITLYTAYQHGTSYHILLELANAGSLNDILLREDPPTNGKAILEFWRELLETIKALVSIHELEEDPRDEGKKVFQGYE
jgi:hypothetical protein